MEAGCNDFSNNCVGFISLLTSQVYPIKYFGVFTAFGIMAAMLFSLAIIPAGIMIFGLPKQKLKVKEEDNHKFAHMVATNVLKYKSISIIATIIIVVISIVGNGKVWINSSFLDKFEKDSVLF